MSNICAVIPAYNAERTIKILIERVKKFIPLEDIVVVDDGSTDMTSEIALGCGANVLKHAKNYGKGKALKTGFKFAILKNYDAVLTLDADLQHDPDEIPKLIDKFSEGFDIVIGNRMKNLKSMPVERIFSNKMTSFLISLRTGQKIPDSQCGFRLIKRAVIEKISVKSDGFSFESEFLIKALLAGFKVGFVEIKTIYNGERSYIKHFSDTFKFIAVYTRSFWGSDFLELKNKR
ncbi:Glycosyltransferase involved in cell wall bisynthesis [Candidatus Kryptonium thompsonii]|uniref:Glycosyltransferase involved in cell wall bisynthesis n=1 Tax=Candidatus Kryptonium thompsonii TaxID=1633631 RepID=A0A0P1MR30_9BACT|nr:glycosyltransferase family 2 protein [Candidatus Kryptonium thompsoni]CUS77647.1 Glycosyltransferase involved in cell wall bisynthesis [Candidatus Kryptonium thompsoni]CUS78530.1 Glycosyltransferase involved in cell wall bisynthesis [Candidatus Kryptonium thompsoni]CUS79968.1 Glycosyltransferase involved in cell wall bisynthesis [Candidatus Kryptonium thompsoni]CUS87252.1 Glycosyltransferase involved in cell wall bisynthesis [Candidatus Kryptonium thompsoni]CUS90863.1 Glycosyltransferase in